MQNKVYNKIISDVRREIVRAAKKNDWMWFYNLHQKEVVTAAQQLLSIQKANEQIVVLACWFHDISKYQIESKNDTTDRHKTHHLDSRDFAEKFLRKYKISKDEKEAILNCVVRHRNKGEHCAETIEDKVVVAADVMSHFNSIFYFTYFKFHPNDSMDVMAKNQLKKIEKDWQDLEVMPKAKKLIKDKYILIKELCENFLDK